VTALTLQAPELVGHAGALGLLAFENVIDGFGHQLIEAGARAAASQRHRWLLLARRRLILEGPPCQDSLHLRHLGTSATLRLAYWSHL
jgi:hypothetical protein